jgi:hypothetical protein
MQRALATIVMFVAIDVAAAAELRTQDIVGTWTLGVADKEYAYYTFRSNLTYTGSKGDMLFEGRWKLLRGNRLQLTPFFDGGVIVINSFDGHTLRAILPDGKKDVWKKMPRWRGSPKY